MNNTVNMQRPPSKTASMPAPGFAGQTSNPYLNRPPNAPPPTMNNQFNMAGAPPPSAPFNSAPVGQYGNNAPYNSGPYNNNAPYNSAPPNMGNMPPQNNMGNMPPQNYNTQQSYGNPPLNQPGMQPPPMQGGYGGYNQQGMAPPGGYVGSVSLAKGGNMSLSKANPNLNRIRIGRSSLFLISKF